MATTSQGTQPPANPDTLQTCLATLLDIHRTRTPKADSAKVVIGLTDDDQTESYRYYDDTHCIRHLSPETKAYLKTEYVEQGQLELVCEGVEFISLKHPEPSGENDVDVIETLLEDLHDTTLEETAYIREIVEDGTYLPIKALCGVNVATETNAGP